MKKANLAFWILSSGILTTAPQIAAAHEGDLAVKIPYDIFCPLTDGLGNKLNVVVRIPSEFQKDRRTITVNGSEYVFTYDPSQPYNLAALAQDANGMFTHCLAAEHSVGNAPSPYVPCEGGIYQCGEN